MKKKILTLLTLICSFSCISHGVSAQKKAVNEEPKNPYYSLTDTTKLNLPDNVWKKVLPESVYKIARLKAPNMHLRENSGIILAWVFTIAPPVVMRCLNLILSSLAHADGQAFIRPYERTV